MREVLDRHLGEGWVRRAAEPETWAPIDQVPASELWEARHAQRSQLIQFVRRRSTQDRLLRGDLRDYVEAAARVFDPDVLTIGFARRVATYKRLDLLTRDPEWTMALLGGARPVQVVLAGKAHPRDEEAKQSLQRLFGLPGDVLDDHAAQDDQVAHALHHALDQEVVPGFYERDADGVPQAWISRMRASLCSLGPRFCAERMLGEYVDRVYRGG
jgi:glucan phosphorylase